MEGGNKKCTPPTDVEMTLSLGRGMRCECCSAQAGHMKNIHAITAATAALFLASCGSNDIVVTSEAGEKLIVERNTIRLHSDSSTQESKDFADKMLQHEIENADFYCSRPEFQDTCEEKKQAIAAVKHKIMLNEGPSWYQEWRYIPIKRDRNGTETVGKERYAQCYSPTLTEEDKTIISGHLIMKSTLSKGTTIYNSAGKTICAEYPKWE